MVVASIGVVTAAAFANQSKEYTPPFARDDDDDDDDNTLVDSLSLDEVVDVDDNGVNRLRLPLNHNSRSFTKCSLALVTPPPPPPAELPLDEPAPDSSPHNPQCNRRRTS